jgi:hypothetical protein
MSERQSWGPGVSSCEAVFHLKICGYELFINLFAHSFVQTMELHAQFSQLSGS